MVDTCLHHHKKIINVNNQINGIIRYDAFTCTSEIMEKPCFHVSVHYWISLGVCTYVVTIESNFLFWSSAHVWLNHLCFLSFLCSSTCTDGTEWTPSDEQVYMHEISLSLSWFIISTSMVVSKSMSMCLELNQSGSTMIWNPFQSHDWAWSVHASSVGNRKEQ